MSRIDAYLLEDCSKHVDQRRQEHGRQWLSAAQPAPEPSSAVDAERSRRRESTSDSGWINSDRCCGAAPFRQRCTSTQSLYWMRSGTRSQCRFTSSGVTWSNLRASAMSRAAEFSTDWIKVTLRQSSHGDVTVVDLGGNTTDRHIQPINVMWSQLTKFHGNRVQLQNSNRLLLWHFNCL